MQISNHYTNVKKGFKQENCNTLHDYCMCSLWSLLFLSGEAEHDMGLGDEAQQNDDS